jgi:hypothetical protein
MGKDTTASGGYSTSLGRLSTASGGYCLAAGRRAKANHIGSFVWADSTDSDYATSANNQFLIRAGGGVGIGTTSPSEQLHVVGNIYASGTITPSSDHNMKRNFAKVDSMDVLERVKSLPIKEWTYKAEDESIRHVGPMAQDFRAAFGLGANDTTIATVDADGVALAAIQGLNQKLEQENAELRRRIERLERLIEMQVEGGAE